MSGRQEMIEESQEESGKKHLLLEVPDHASQSGDETRTMTTFLRMGTFDADAPGMALIEEAEQFIDDTRDRGNNVAGFPAGSPGHPLTTAARKQETARLRTRGGWQDHSDGNRISTTMGDKVEIVRGNYKLLVLGRQDDQGKAAGWDVSGGKIEDGDVYPPSYTEWKWVQTWGGTWKLTQMVEKTDVHEITHGDLKEEFYGDHIESIIGAEVPTSAVEHAVEQSKKNQPDIIERTWAKSITSFTGSAIAPVPAITETTFAGAITSTTTATTTVETTTVATATEVVNVISSSSVTNVGVMQESKTLGGTATIVDIVGDAANKVLKVENKLYAKTVDETSIIDAASSNAVYGASSTNEVFGAKHESTTAGVHDEISLFGAHFSFIAAGVMLDIELSLLRGEIKAGLGFLEIEAAIIYVELFIGIKMEIKLGGEIKYDTSSKEFSLDKTVGIGL